MERLVLIAQGNWVRQPVSTAYVVENCGLALVEPRSHILSKWSVLSEKLFILMWLLGAQEGFQGLRPGLPIRLMLPPLTLLSKLRGHMGLLFLLRLSSSPRAVTPLFTLCFLSPSWERLFSVAACVHVVLGQPKHIQGCNLGVLCSSLERRDTDSLPVTDSAVPFANYSEKCAETTATQ